MPKPKKTVKVKQSKARKLSDAQFFSILRDNAGLFSMTARAIQKKFKIAYTRQAVRDRALNHPDILADIDEENLDIAEGGLTSMMKSKANNIRLDAIKYFLDRKGKKRGYQQKTSTDITIKKLGKDLEDEQYT